MSLEQLASILDGIPGFENRVAYDAFPDGESPGLPCIVYRETGAENLNADDTVFCSFPIVDIELYTAMKDTTSEAAVEAALRSACLVWTKDTQYLHAERCYMTTYTVTI